MPSPLPADRPSARDRARALWDTIVGRPGPKMVRVAVARHLSETELLLALLHQAQIPAQARRTSGFDVPDMLAAGPRDILVPEHFELDARSVIQPIFDDARVHDEEPDTGPR